MHHFVSFIYILSKEYSFTRDWNSMLKFSFIIFNECIKYVNILQKMFLKLHLPDPDVLNLYPHSSLPAVSI